VEAVAFLDFEILYKLQNLLLVLGIFQFLQMNLQLPPYNQMVDLFYLQVSHQQRKMVEYFQ
jgi:hypothetical protein